SLERMPRAPGAEMVIAIAGPMVNFVIAGLLVMAISVGSAIEPGAAQSSVAAFAWQLLVINLGLGLFNLIPAFPMVGVRIFRALLTIPFGRLRATEIAAWLGRILAVGLPIVLWTLGMLNPMHIILALFLFHVGGMELNMVRAEEHRRRFGEDVWAAPP